MFLRFWLREQKGMLGESEDTTSPRAGHVACRLLPAKPPWNLLLATDAPDSRPSDSHARLAAPLCIAPCVRCFAAGEGDLMERLWNWKILLTLHLLVLCPSAFASEIRMERIAATSQGFLFLEMEFVEAFDGLYLEAIQSGLPTTLHYTVEVWRHRSGWWDRLERTQERRFRLFRDVLSGEYWLVTDEESQRFANFEALLDAVTRFRQHTSPLPLPFPSADLPGDKEYYLIVTANLTPLSVEDLNELDEWLKGTIRGGNPDNNTGVISGLSRTMGGLLLSLTGFGDRTMRARSPSFRPQEIPLQPIVLYEPPTEVQMAPLLPELTPTNDSTQVERNDGGPEPRKEQHFKGQHLYPER